MAAMALLTAVEYDGDRRGILIFPADVERESSLGDPSRNRPCQVLTPSA